MLNPILPCPQGFPVREGFSDPLPVETSQELRMLSSVTIKCQITKIVRIVISVSNVTSPRIVQKSGNLPKI